jgi:hypothetical protein
MAYELTCPSCQARLHLKDDASEEFLLCPRCLKKVPRPASAGPALRPAAETSAINTLSTRSTRSVPTVEAETGRSIWSAYFVILMLTLFAGLGVVFAAKGPGNIGTLIPLCNCALTVLILFPVGYAMVRGIRPGTGTPLRVTLLKKIVVVVLLVILGPIATFIVFVVVCLASSAVVK